MKMYMHIYINTYIHTFLCIYIYMHAQYVQMYMYYKHTMELLRICYKRCCKHSVSMLWTFS